MRLVLIADTHNLHDQLVMPEGDVLIHAGDMTMGGLDYEVENFAHWLEKQPYAIKVVTPGNHDWLFQRKPDIARRMIVNAGGILLLDQGFQTQGVTFYGTPWQPWFFDWAFNVPRGGLQPYWDKIPTGTDVLITHGPPYMIGDRTQRGEHVGCEQLLDTVHIRVKPQIHVFGHIHEGRGHTRPILGTEFFNATVVDHTYRVMYEPYVVEI